MAAADSDFIRFGCPKCQKRLTAPLSLAGGRTRCPYCQTMLDVPRRSRTDAVHEEYRLQSGTGSLPDEQPQYVLVVCPVCHARLHAEESQIGQKIVCPDCGTPTIVTRPPEKPAKKPQRSAEEIGEYPLASEAVRKPRSVPAAEQRYVPVVCSLCHTRMHATVDQVGSNMICPDCGTATVVPAMPPPRAKIDVMAGADDGYALVGWDDKRSAGPPPSPPPRMSEEPVESPDSACEPDAEPTSRRPVLPDRPFLDGTFDFPFYRTVWLRTLLLAIWSLLPPVLWYKSVVLGGSEDATKMFTSAFLMCAAMFVGLIWFFVLSTTVLVVLRETSEGCDQIENWPNHVFLDYFGEPLHLFCALCTSVIPGAAAGWGLSSLGFPAQLFLPVGMFFFFPIILLSTLETNSMFGIVSWPVWRTLWTDGVGWIRFYVASAAVVAAASLAAFVAYRIGPIFGGVVAAALQSVAWMIYFRLVGRLAWYCADRAAFADLEAQMAELNDEDFDEQSDDEELLT
jgi:DNA-directed RNA polymerase subunit RPC12/RpoP